MVFTSDMQWESDDKPGGGTYTYAKLGRMVGKIAMLESPVQMSEVLYSLSSLSSEYTPFVSNVILLTILG